MDTTEQQPGSEPVPLEGAPDPAQGPPDSAPAEPLEGAPEVDDPDDAETRGEDDVEPVTPPEGVVSDAHDHPLDDEDDARLLPRDDPRRKAVEESRGEQFDDQEPEGDATEDDGDAADGGTAAADDQAAGDDDGEQESE